MVLRLFIRLSVPHQKLQLLVINLLLLFLNHELQVLVGLDHHFELLVVKSLLLAALVVLD